MFVCHTHTLLEAYQTIMRPHPRVPVPAVRVAFSSPAQPHWHSRAARRVPAAVGGASRGAGAVPRAGRRGARDPRDAGEEAGAVRAHHPKS